MYLSAGLDAELIYAHVIRMLYAVDSAAMARHLSNNGIDEERPFVSANFTFSESVKISRRQLVNPDCMAC